MIRWLLLSIALALAVPAHADELRPGYLELTQQDSQHWRMVWKAPVLGGLATHARPLVPPQCRQSAPTARLEGAALIAESRLTCDRDLAGTGLAARQVLERGAGSGIGQGLRAQVEGDCTGDTAG